ncbi:class I SAM-dependent methyltransferase [Paludisphaera rhizosphaerae]|uniref:class I SAM-dependent methyltransferase n=1 Tax=Paludisphaera rhizosphaerae TaxID=2711216 RepID=UPI0013EDB145|nr:class I SAM-dependent methyltransferase [Paludisphaera rhizosphaerae]
MNVMSQVDRYNDPIGTRLDRYVLFDRVNRPYAAWQVQQFRPYLGRRILEIGCGVGGIIDLLGPRDQIVGVDVEEDVLAYASDRFRDRPECRFLLADVGNLDGSVLAELEAQEFDTLICMNVLEHVRDDVAALQMMERLLAPNGVLALLVPAHLALYGPYDKLDGHYRRYSKSYLRTILGHTGLGEIRMHYFNAVGAAGWWVHHRLLKRTIHGNGQFAVMNRLLPFVRLAEAWIKPPFGLSLVAVCRKA